MCRRLLLDVVAPHRSVAGAKELARVLDEPVRVLECAVLAGVVSTSGDMRAQRADGALLARAVLERVEAGRSGRRSPT